MIKYPIGVQSFEKLIEGKYHYIDKTAYIRRLVEYGNIYFLGRPRRFGKSLLLSTLHAFFEGKRHLFKGLAIDRWEEWEWESYPVIHIDLNAKNYMLQNSLTERISRQLEEYEKEYRIIPPDSSLDGRLMGIIKTAYESTGRKVVVLIDEYDKPILDTLHDDSLKTMHRDSLRAFYSVLKSSDQYLKFCFLTGITKFGQLNIFSGLNNLHDISLSEDFSGICGITERELHDNFDEGVRACADKWKCDVDEAYATLKKFYDGYHFSAELLDVYNPWSLLYALRERSIGYYWNASGGTASFLYKLIEARKLPLSDLADVRCHLQALQGTRIDASEPIPVLYQTGYLTIKSYNPARQVFQLKYPNYEVEKGFIEGLLPLYTGAGEEYSNFAIDDFVDDVTAGDADGFLRRMKAFFADFPYENSLKTEKDFQSVMYCVAALMGLQVQVERHSALGSADLVIQTKDYVYIIEFKVDKSPDEALAQIESKGYAGPFASDPRTVVRIGVAFSLAMRNISEWKIVS